MSWFSAPAYYAYVLGPDGNIQSRVDLYCDNDEEAERVIEQLLDRHAIELWQASRRIATYQPKN